MREIYARILSQEERSPGAFALRTLGVLRYMDRKVAIAFGRLQKVLIDQLVVPQQAASKDHVLQKVGLDHSTMLMLNDAGLVSSSASSERTYDGPGPFFLICSGHRRVLAVSPKEGGPKRIKLKVHLLTPAGIELARIAECEPDETAFAALVSWIRPQVMGAEISVADLPSPGWSGPAAELTWRSLDQEAAQPGVAADGAPPRS